MIEWPDMSLPPINLWNVPKLEDKNMRKLKVRKAVSCDGYTVYSNGDVYSPLGKKLRPSRKSDGYMVVWLGDTMYRMHRLVAQCFIPNPENKRCVNHKDGVKANNNVENLEWATHSENMNHAYATGLWEPQRGETNPNSKLSSEEVQVICKSYPERKYGWAKATCELYGISRNTLYAIVNGRRYAETQAV